MVSSAHPDPGGAEPDGAGQADADPVEPAPAESGDGEPDDGDAEPAPGGPVDPGDADAVEPGGAESGRGDAGQPDRIVRGSLWATGVFTVVQVVAVGLPDTFAVVSVPVSLALFVAGAVAFVWGFAVAIGRSRYEAVTLGGLFFLGDGAAPADIRRALRALLAVQVVVAVVAASVRPFTELAFGILAPMLGMGMLTLWGARYGEFAPRDEPAEPGGARN